MSDFFVESMAEALAADKSRNGSSRKIYKVESDAHKNEQISLSITNRNNALRNAINAPKVDLSNTQEVQERTHAYFEACSMSSCFPSVMGLSAALGCSRQNLNRWLLSHAEHPSANVINMAKDVMADLLVDSSLHNNSNPVMSIFVLKNNHGFADRVEVAPITPERNDSEYDPEDIRRRYLPYSEVDTDTDE